MKKILVWSLYFIVCGLVIAFAIHAGANRNDCGDCATAFGMIK